VGVVAFSLFMMRALFGGEAGRVTASGDLAAKPSLAGG